MSVAAICVVNCAALMNVVGRTTPLKLTVAPLTKPMPFTVKVNAGSPAVAVAGEMLVITAPTSRLTAVDVPPRGFITVHGNVPKFAVPAASMVAVNSVGLPKGEGRAIHLK